MGLACVSARAFQIMLALLRLGKCVRRETNWLVVPPCPTCYSSVPVTNSIEVERVDSRAP